MAERQTNQGLITEIKERATALAASLTTGERFTQVVALRAQRPPLATLRSIRAVWQEGPRIRRLYAKSLGKQLLELGLETAEQTDNRVSKKVRRGVAFAGYCLEEIASGRRPHL